MTVIAAASEGPGLSVFMAADRNSHVEEITMPIGKPKVRAFVLDDGSVLGIGGAGDTAVTKLAVSRALESLDFRGPADPHDPDICADWAQEFAEQWTVEAMALEPTPLITANDGTTRLDGSLILAYNGILYYAGTNECEPLESDYAATGAGVMFALGSLYTSGIGTLVTPNLRVRAAVEAANRFDKFCGGGMDMVRIPGVTETSGVVEAEREAPE